ncbi:formate dehydrogenase accessory sulfurtransferase FdhD [Pseudomonas sp. LFM046]|uniref:formate dehydrogenase accessory sulfurtransferase FdhD n=1 Tax=Pseudomonas sp. LFM046 TaxID=1608357 RepID=UPI0005CF993F|nr:formate dehydrogenase accessory sulfurtransferase FdhD [Pseudomonas sp. LFM046]
MPRPDAKRPLTAVDNPPAPTGYRYAELDEGARVEDAALAEECALAISYNGISYAVMMVSPSALEDFVAGFSLSSAVVQSIDELYDIQIEGEGIALHAEVDIGNRAFWSFKEQRRNLAGTTGCGLCGVEALEQALPELRSLTPAPLPPAEHFVDLRQRINEAQELARRSGALHAALFVDDKGELRLCREDIGRHNALDKLIGALLRQGLNPREGFAVVTSRCSLELIHKAVRAGLSTLVSLSAPTTLTVEWARRHHLNLIHLPHHSAPRVYSPAPKSEAPNE